MSKGDERIVSPARTLWALFALTGGCALLMWLIPSSGIPLGNDLTLRFASFKDLLPKENKGIQDAEAFLSQYDQVLLEVDSTEIKAETDSLQALEKAEAARLEQAAIRERMKIHGGPGGIRNLSGFFESAENANKNEEQVRVMHYGDSQIEADRITRLVRNELQKSFGGYGPGLIAPVEIVPTGAIVQSADDAWKRFTIYGKKDSSITHQRYGVLGSFAQNDSTPARLNFAPSRMGHALVKRYDQVRLFYTNADEDAQLVVSKNDSTILSRNLKADSASHTLNLPIHSGLGEVTMEIQDASVEIQALSFESKKGLLVDNIPMRGSSGTIFRKIDRKQFAQQLKTLNPSLVLLQYGGNSVPYVRDSTQASNYGKWMRSQIRLFQQVLPEAAIIVIGPSDMATKIDGEFTTYPYLEAVRDALKSAALDLGCGYWDLYEVMGGRNSMEAWVAADPPLAGPDYVHFTPKGANKVAELFMKALMDERNGTE